jgi:hypothetical protein
VKKWEHKKNIDEFYESSFWPVLLFDARSELKFVNVYGAQESIPAAYVAWLAGTSNRGVEPAR